MKRVTQGAILLLAIVVADVAWLHAQVTPIAPITTLQAVNVTASRVAASDVEGPEAIERYDDAQIASTGAFSVQEFLASLPAAEEGTQQLVLIDGRPTFLDPATLPLGMIAGIDVSRDGSMPSIGAYSSGRIINIRLKPAYVGGEVGGKFSGTFAGGGSSFTTRLSSTSNRGKWRTLVSLELSRNAALSALDRDFSRDQDHRPRGGRDFRLGWGYPAVIQSVSGNLPGLGSRVALVAEQPDAGAPTSPLFLPGDPAVGTSAANQRRFDTARYLALVPPSERASLNFELSYALTERVRLAFSGSHSRTETRRPGAPPVTPVSANTLVPAALNPFGQDVRVGLLHVEFGATEQHTLSERTQFGLQAGGRWGKAWRWDSRLGHRRDGSRQTTPDLDPTLFAEALRQVDPSLRFNPFVDATLQPVNAHLYPALLGERRSSNLRQSSEIDLSVRGPLAQWRGGAVTLNADAEVEHAERERVSNRITGGPLTRSQVESIAQEISAGLNLPFVGTRNPLPGIRRLETQLSGQYMTATDGAGESDAEVGLVWSPSKAVLFRGRASVNVETPTREFAAGADRIVGESLIDPRRGGETLNDVQAVTRSLAPAESEESESTSFGVTLEPPKVKGLRVSTTYRDRRQHRLYQNRFAVQDVVNNELTLTGRVTRLPASTEDAAQGRPGVITTVDLTPGNTGEASQTGLDFSFEYRMPEKAFGTLRATVSAERQLQSRYEILPGVPFVQEGGSRFRRPKWSGDGTLAWSRRGGNASVRVRYSGPVAATGASRNAIEATTLVDLNAGYRFQSKPNPFTRKKDLRLTVGISNAFDEPPPWVDHVNGFRSGSPLGRTYSLALTLAL